MAIYIYNESSGRPSGPVGDENMKLQFLIGLLVVPLLPAAAADPVSNGLENLSSCSTNLLQHMWLDDQGAVWHEFVTEGMCIYSDAYHYSGGFTSTQTGYYRHRTIVPSIVCEPSC